MCIKKCAGLLWTHSWIVSQLIVGFIIISHLKTDSDLESFDFHFQINKSTFTKIEENTEKKNTPEKGRATIIFSLKNEVGGLVKALKLFQVWLSY